MTTTTTDEITVDQVFAALPHDGSAIYALDIVTRMGLAWQPHVQQVRAQLLTLQRLGHADLHHGSGWHRIMRDDVELSQRAYDELARLLKEARDAADGDSNDAEIEAWQEFGAAVEQYLGIVEPEGEGEADPWSVDPVTPARGGR